MKFVMVRKNETFPCETASRRQQALNYIHFFFIYGGNRFFQSAKITDLNIVNLFCEFNFFATIDLLKEICNIQYL